MDLSLDEAAVELGVTARQVRYLIQTEKLRASKRQGRWVVKREDLPRREGAVVRTRTVVVELPEEAFGSTPWSPAEIAGDLYPLAKPHLNGATLARDVGARRLRCHSRRRPSAGPASSPRLSSQT